MSHGQHADEARTESSVAVAQPPAPPGAGRDPPAGPLRRLHDRLDPVEAIRAAADTLRTTLGADLAGLAVLTAGASDAELRQPARGAGRAGATLRMALGDSGGEAAAAIQMGRTLAIADLGVGPPAAPAGAAAPRALLAVPLAMAGGAVEFLCAASLQPRAWRATDIALAEALAACIAASRRAAGAEAARRAQEERQRLAEDTTGFGTWELDLETGAMPVTSVGHDRIFGSEETPAGWSLAHMEGRLEEEDRAVFRVAFARAAETGAVDVEVRVRAGDGSLRRIAMTGRLAVGGPGGARRMIGVVADVTARRRLEEDLREAADPLRLAQALSGIGVFDWHPATGAIDWSEEIVRIYGTTAAALGNAYETWRTLVVPEDLVPLEGMVAAAFARREPRISFGFRIRRPNGEIRSVKGAAAITYAQDGAPLHVVGVKLDVTDAQQAQAALRASEERLRLAQEAAGVGMWDLDIPAGRATCSEAYCRIYGLDPAGPGHQSVEEWLAQVHPEDRARAAAAAEAGIASGRYECEYRIIRTDGATKWLASRGMTIFGDDGRPWRFLGLAADVTALRESELRLRLAIEGTGLCTWDYDYRTDEALWSRGHFDAFGYPPQPGGRATGAMWRDAIHPEDWPRVRQTIEDCRDGQRFRIVYRIRRVSDGAERWMESLGRDVEHVAGAAPRRLIGITVDVTEREATRARLQLVQAELLHVSRLGEAGVMASALAHELNQPLTASASAIQAARRMLARRGAACPPGIAADVAEALDLAAAQTLRAGEIIRRLRDFVSRGEGDKRLEHLPGLIHEAVELATIGVRQHRVRVIFDIPAGLPQVVADRVEIQQVMFNLVRNAVQAMAEAPATAASRRDLTVTARATGEEVEVAVADTGPGLSAAVAARLFEPFVTTRREGMGIGLSICRTIIEAHGGRLWAMPNPGGGTVFRFSLPAHQATREEGSDA